MRENFRLLIELLLVQQKYLTHNVKIYCLQNFSIRSEIKLYITFYYMAFLLYFDTSEKNIKISHLFNTKYIKLLISLDHP